MIILLCGRDQCRLNAHPVHSDSMRIESWSSVDRPLFYNNWRAEALLSVELSEFSLYLYIKD